MPNSILPSRPPRRMPTRRAQREIKGLTGAAILSEMEMVLKAKLLDHGVKLDAQLRLCIVQTLDWLMAEFEVLLTNTSRSPQHEMILQKLIEQQIQESIVVGTTSTRQVAEEIAAIVAQSLYGFADEDPGFWQRFLGGAK